MSRKMRRKHIHYLSMLLVFRDCRIFFGSVASPETKNMIPDAVVGSMGGDAGALPSASRQRSAGIEDVERGAELDPGIPHPRFRVQVRT